MQGLGNRKCSDVDWLLKYMGPSLLRSNLVLPITSFIIVLPLRQAPGNERCLEVAPQRYAPPTCGLKRVWLVTALECDHASFF